MGYPMYHTGAGLQKLPRNQIDLSLASFELLLEALPRTLPPAGVLTLRTLKAVASNKFASAIIPMSVCTFWRKTRHWKHPHPVEHSSCPKLRCLNLELCQVPSTPHDSLGIKTRTVAQWPSSFARISVKAHLPKANRPLTFWFPPWSKSSRPNQTGQLRGPSAPEAHHTAPLRTPAAWPASPASRFRSFSKNEVIFQQGEKGPVKEGGFQFDPGVQIPPLKPWGFNRATFFV